MISIRSASSRTSSTARSGRVERHARLHARSVYLLDGAVQMCTRLGMHGHYLAARLAHSVYIVLRMYGHHVNIEHLAAQALGRLDDGKAKGYVRDKHPIHYVQVQPVGSAPVNHIELLGQLAKVGRQQGGGYYRVIFHRTHYYIYKYQFMQVL